jgi:N-terminal domain of oxidoreductase
MAGVARPLLRSYAPPYEVGQVLYGGAVGQVVAARTPAFAVGDIVLSNNDWREYFVSDGSGLERIAPVVPPSYYLGVLGMPGLSAPKRRLPAARAVHSRPRDQASQVVRRAVTGAAPPSPPVGRGGV